MLKYLRHCLNLTVGVIPSTFISLLLFAAVAIGDDAPLRDESNESPSLDEQLLGELDDDLLDDLDDPSDDPPSENGDAGETDAPPTGIDDDLLDQIGQGEDIGEGPGNPLVQIARKMKAVETLIGQQETSERTQALQQQLIDELDALMKMAANQRQPQPGDDNRQPGGGSPPMPGAGEGGGVDDSSTPADEPAEDSEDRIGQTNGPVTAAPDASMDIVRDVWGHLPERVRQEVQSASGEEILPQYRELIEEYYKRLAQEAANRP